MEPNSILSQLKFDGSNLGSIDKHVIRRFTNIDPKSVDTEYKVLNIITVGGTGDSTSSGFKESLSLVLHEYRSGAPERSSEVPIILDKIKPLFHIFKTRYHILYYEGVKYLAHEYSNEVPLRDYLKYNENEVSGTFGAKQSSIVGDTKYYDTGTVHSAKGLIPDAVYSAKRSLKYDVQRLLIFNWIMNVGGNTDSKFWVKNYKFDRLSTSNIYESFNVYPFSFNERSISILLGEESSRKIESEIPNKMLEDWFDNDINVFIQKAKLMLRGFDKSRFIAEMERAIKSHNSVFREWIDAVLKNVLYIRNL
jgi:hypothetical protein